MPRGFLVKRSKKSGAVSYRVREECSATAEPSQTAYPAAPAPAAPYHTLATERTLVRRIQRRLSFGGLPEAQSPPTLSPNRAVSGECRQQQPSADHLDRKLNSSSPVQAESFPESSLATSASHMSAPPSLAEMTTKLGSACREQEAPAAAAKRLLGAKVQQSNGKRQKSSHACPGGKRPGCRDDVTTSPVLGLRIEGVPEEEEEEAKPRCGSPLGEFICQLCKRRFADPLALAQHKCSRIVRVDYRCAECDKVFSCPANLASHRRWHKPRGARPEREEAPSAAAAGDEPRSASARQDARTPPPSERATEEEAAAAAAFECPLCAKRFRRQAYLRKHVALHARQGDKKGAGWCQGAELAPPFRLCRDAFVSSPGLPSHVGKCRPTEGRQLTVPSRTG